MFNKISELLESDSISKEAAEAIDAEVSSALKELRDEASNTRTKLKETETAYTGKLEEQKSDIESRIAEATKTGESEAAKLWKEKLDTLETERSQLEQKAKNAIIDASVNKVLAEKQVVDADIARLYIKDHLVLDGDNPMIEIGQETLSFDAGVDKLFESKQHLLKPVGDTGGGAGGDYGGGKTAPKLDGTEAQKLAAVGSILDELKG